MKLLTLLFLLTSCEDFAPEVIGGDCVRIFHYRKNGKLFRALVKRLCYICNDQGKTIEKIEIYSGARLSAV